MTQSYPHIIPDISRWPVARQSRERAQFIEKLNEFALKRLLAEHEGKLQELVSKTAYMESQRIRTNPWKVDPADEKKYWKSISAELDAASGREDKDDVELSILKKIINRYNEEIVGHFSPSTFKFSRIFLTSFFKRLFNRYFEKGRWRWGNREGLKQKIRIKGNLPLIRELFEKGTVVIMPTHYSNLDSIMVGYAIDANAGLPSFSYGAGLNLYNTEIVAYFINRLGAFRVDRRKKNPIYLECLKSMTGYSIIDDVNCLFFPGGTRSRSGQTEDRLKLGLISSVIEAQRIHFETGQDRKIYVVPLCIGYHFVLEANQLIDQHLRQAGRDKYKGVRIPSISFSNVLKFVKDVFTRSSEVYMSFGDPMDVFGNQVNEQGESMDKFGNQLNLADYFTLDGALAPNLQRESIYARLLAEKVVASYRKFNVVLSSNVVAFAAFHLIYRDYAENGIFSLLNVRDVNFKISKQDMLDAISSLVSHLQELAEQNNITLSDEMWNNAESIYREGMNKLGIYHYRSVLKETGTDELMCPDIRILYFYHNRLVNYGLEAHMHWPEAIIKSA
jgi:glycerol-3-phosphate O-acyltransferase